MNVIKLIVNFILTSLAIIFFVIMVALFGFPTWWVLGILLSPVILIAVLLLFSFAYSKIFKKEFGKDEKREQRRLNLQIQQKQECDELIDAIKPHRLALKRNLEGAIIMNDYGAIAEDNQDEVIKEFMESVGLDRRVIGIKRTKEIIFEQLAILEKTH